MMGAAPDPQFQYIRLREICQYSEDRKQAKHIQTYSEDRKQVKLIRAACTDRSL